MMCQTSAIQRPFPLSQGLVSQLEYPFAWGSEQHRNLLLPILLPPGEGLTISFTTKRWSKILGYIPGVGTGIGFYRLYKGFREYQIFKKCNSFESFNQAARLSSRGKRWCVRGALEIVPLVGNLACVVADIAATILLKLQK